MDVKQRIRPIVKYVKKYDRPILTPHEMTEIEEDFDISLSNCDYLIAITEEELGKILGGQ